MSERAELLIYGHRGAKGEAPENTLAGFLHAYRHGIRHFEMDVLLSSDGIPVLLHDLTLDRTTYFQGRAGTYNAEQLGDMDARRNTASWPYTTGIPTLDEMFSQCPEVRHLQLEVKPDERRRLNRLCNRLVEWVQREKAYDRITLTSRSSTFLRAVRRRDRRISTGYVAERRFPAPLRQARQLGCQYLCCSTRLARPSLVEQAHEAGLHVSVWTVNRIHDMLILESMGVDSIITDYPTSALVYFENHHNRRRFVTAPDVDEPIGTPGMPTDPETSH